MEIKKSISFVLEVLVEDSIDNDTFKETIILRAPNGQPLAFVDYYNEIEYFVSSYLYPNQDKES